MLNDALFNSKMTHLCTIKEKSMDGDGKDIEVVLFSNQPCYFNGKAKLLVGTAKN